MTDIVPGLVDGKAPLLTEFLCKRATLIARLDNYKVALRVTPFAPHVLIIERRNMLADLLCGRSLRGAA